MSVLYQFETLSAISCVCCASAFGWDGVGGFWVAPYSELKDSTLSARSTRARFATTCDECTNSLGAKRNSLKNASIITIFFGSIHTTICVQRDFLKQEGNERLPLVDGAVVQFQNRVCLAGEDFVIGDHRESVYQLRTDLAGP